MAPSAGKNLLLKAVYLICKAETNDISNQEENQQLLEVSLSHQMGLRATCKGIRYLCCNAKVSSLGFAVK